MFVFILQLNIEPLVLAPLLKFSAFNMNFCSLNKFVVSTPRLSSDCDRLLVIKLVSLGCIIS